jgi:hypothetical protein
MCAAASGVNRFAHSHDGGPAAGGPAWPWPMHRKAHRRLLCSLRREDHAYMLGMPKAAPQLGDYLGGL